MHPGLFYTMDDLTRMKTAVAQKQEPWLSSFRLLGANLAYKASPVVNETIGTGQFQIRADADQGNALALTWFITGDIRYAQAAIKIINAWTSTMQTFDPVDNLSASEAIRGFGEAAEILIYTGTSGWKTADIARYKSMMLTRLYPAVAKSKTDGMMGNQGIDAVSAAMAVGIALDIPQYFQDGVTAWTQHPCVAITKFIQPSGQNGEAGRDQPHSSGELTAANNWAMLAWNQGVDLYQTGGNRLLAGYEYWTKYNLGYSVPYTPISLCNYNAANISSSYRGRIATVDLERIYRIFVTEKKQAAPNVQQALTRIGITSGTLLSYAGKPTTDAAVILDGSYAIGSALTGKVVSTPLDSSVNETSLDMELYSARKSQVWTFTRFAGNIYKVVNAQQKAIDVPGASIDPGTRLDSYSPNGGLWQAWRVGQNANGSYYLMNANSGWSMSIAGGSAAVGAIVQQDNVPAINPPLWQQWTLTAAKRSGP